MSVHPIVCRTPWKIRYATRRDALIHSRHAKGAKGQLRPYWCEPCQAWHLSTMNRRQHKQMLAHTRKKDA